MKRVVLIGVIGFMVFGLGCLKKDQIQGETSVSTTSPSTTSTTIPSVKYDKPETIIAGGSVKGKPIEMVSLELSGDTDKKQTVLILGTLQGNEPAGAKICTKLMGYLKDHTEILHDRKVLLIPVVNIDGCESNTRLNANKVDLNRDFPMSKTQKIDGLQPETRAVVDVIQKYNPNRIIIIRQLGYIDFDLPAGRKQEIDRYKKYLNSYAPKLKFIDDHTKPGSLGKYGSEVMGIDTISFGLPVNADKLDENEVWEQYGSALLALIKYSSEKQESLAAPAAPAVKPKAPPCFKPGYVLYRQGEYAGATQKFEECLKSLKDCQICQQYIDKSQNAMKAFEAGLNFYQQNDCKSAVLEFQKVLKINKKDKRAEDYIKDCNAKNVNESGDDAGNPQ